MIYCVLRVDLFEYLISNRFLVLLRVSQKILVAFSIVKSSLYVASPKIRPKCRLFKIPKLHCHVVADGSPRCGRHFYVGFSESSMQIIRECFMLWHVITSWQGYAHDTTSIFLHNFFSSWILQILCFQLSIFANFPLRMSFMATK